MLSTLMYKQTYESLYSKRMDWRLPPAPAVTLCFMGHDPSGICTPECLEDRPVFMADMEMQLPIGFAQVFVQK